MQSRDWTQRPIKMLLFMEIAFKCQLVKNIYQMPRDGITKDDPSSLSLFVFKSIVIPEETT
jgi:hypothetical protein